MAKFRTVPGTTIAGIGKANAEGIIETKDPKQIEALKKNRYCEEIKGAEKAKDEAPETPPKSK